MRSLAHALVVPCLSLGALLLIWAFAYRALKRPARVRFSRKPGRHKGRHALAPQHHHARTAGEDEFYDARERTDPDGTLFLAALKHAPGYDAIDPEPHEHHQQYVPALETAAAISARELPLSGRLEPVPDDLPADATRPQPVVVQELGMPTGEWVDETFSDIDLEALWADAESRFGVLPAKDLGSDETEAA